MLKYFIMAEEVKITISIFVFRMKEMLFDHKLMVTDFSFGKIVSFIIAICY